MLVRAGLLDIDERLQALRIGRATPTVVEARAKLSDRAIAGSPQDLTRREFDLGGGRSHIVLQKQPLLEGGLQVVQAASLVGLLVVAGRAAPRPFIDVVLSGLLLLADSRTRASLAALRPPVSMTLSRIFNRG